MGQKEVGDEEESFGSVPASGKEREEPPFISVILE